MDPVARRSTFFVLLALALVVALTGCSGKKAEPKAAGSPSPSLQTPSSPTPGATSSSPGKSSGGSASTPAPGGQTTTGPAPGAKPFVPRPAGVYSYATSGQTQLTGAIKRTYGMPPTTTLTVDPGSGGAQRSVRDFRDEDGNGRVTEMRIRSAANGFYLEYLRNTTKIAGVTDVRTFQPNPPPLILRAGAPNGDHLTFTIEGSGVTAMSEVDVLRRETITIGGKSLQAIVIRIHTTFSGDVEGEETATNWLRPSDGLLLRDQSNATVDAGFTTVKTNYLATLKNLTPA